MSRDDLKSEAGRIMAMLTQAEMLLQEADRLKKQARGEIVKFAAVAREWADEAPRSQILDLQDFIYWDTNIPFRDWPSALGVRRQFGNEKGGGSPRPTLKTRTFWFMCHACGKEYVHEAYTRTERDRGTGECPDCKSRSEERRAERQAEWAAQRIARELTVEYHKTMPYHEYLRTDHWQAVRANALRRSGYRCATCNAKGVTLDVHHRTYERRGEEHASDVIALCRACHRRFHGVES